MNTQKMPVCLLKVGDSFKYIDGRKWMITEIIKPTHDRNYINITAGNYEVRATCGTMRDRFYFARARLVDKIINE